MTSATPSLWVPESARDDAHFKKARAPLTGPQHGSWAGRDLTYLNFPGGAALAFDLSKLTLSDYRTMRTHYQVNASQSLLMFMMHQGDWQIKSDDAKVARRVDDVIRPIWTRLVRGLSQAFWAGFSPNVIEYDNDGPSKRVIVSKIKDLAPEECRVNWKTVLGAPASPGAAPIRLYEYDGIAQVSYGVGAGFQFVEPDYTLWYPCMMENGNYYGKKLLKPAFVPWFFSQLIHLFTNRYYERFGEPVPIGRADFEDTVIDEHGNAINGRTAMENILTRLRNRGVVVLPSDRVPTGDGTRSEYAFDIEYLESQMRGADWERYLLRLDEEISLGLFTPLSALRIGENGGMNQVQVHLQVFLWQLNAFAGDWKEYIDRYLVQRIVDFNFGPNAARAEWVPKKFGKDNAETLRALVMESIRVGDVKPDVMELGEAIGISLEDVSELVRPVNALGEDPNNPIANPAAVNQVPTPAQGGTANGTPRADQRSVRGTHQDRRVPKTGDSGVIRHKLAERLVGQFHKAKYAGHEQFEPDVGFRRQLEDFFDDDDRADDLMRRMGLWASDAYAVVDLDSEFRTMCENVLEVELS